MAAHGKSRWVTRVSPLSTGLRGAGTIRPTGLTKKVLMSMKLFELKKEREEALNAAERVLKVAESAGREMTASEVNLCDSHLKRATAFNPDIERMEKANTLRGVFGSRVPNSTSENRPQPLLQPQPSESKMVLSAGYPDAFQEYIRSGGTQVSVALYEGSNSGGG